MAELDLDALPAWLRRQRWFGGKGAEIASVRVVDEARLGALAVATIEVRYGDRPPERYLLPLRGGADGPLEDALDEQSCRTIFDVLRERREIRTQAGILRGERFDAADSPLSRLPERPTVRRLSAEQSNTSLVFGEAVILKLIPKPGGGGKPGRGVGAVLGRGGVPADPPLAR